MCSIVQPNASEGLEFQQDAVAKRCLGSCSSRLFRHYPLRAGEVTVQAPSDVVQLTPSCGQENPHDCLGKTYNEKIAASGLSVCRLRSCCASVSRDFSSTGPSRHRSKEQGEDEHEKEASRLRLTLPSYRCTSSSVSPNCPVYDSFQIMQEAGKVWIVPGT